MNKTQNYCSICGKTFKGGQSITGIGRFNLEGALVAYCTSHKENNKVNDHIDPGMDVNLRRDERRSDQLGDPEEPTLLEQVAEISAKQIGELSELMLGLTAEIDKLELAWAKRIVTLEQRVTELEKC